MKKFGRYRSNEIKYRFFKSKICKNLVVYRTQAPISHFTVMDGSEADGDHVLIQTSLLYYVNQVILMLTSIFQGQFP